MRYVLYHDQCFDGCTAAWITWTALHKQNDSPITLVSCQYGKPTPELEPNSEVYLVDFSFPREVMETLNALSSKMVVLDHHKTAKEACEGLPYCVFDMERSGAGLAWDHFNPETPRPKLVDYVEDRDLWRFKLPDSHAIHVWLATYQKDPLTYGVVANRLEDKFNECLVEGKAIIGYHQMKVKEIAAEARLIEIGGYTVPCANAPYQFGSDVAHLLLDRYSTSPFAAYFCIDRSHVFKYGLRGRDSDKFDVSVVAKLYGGGGHKKAAGFERKEEL